LSTGLATAALAKGPQPGPQADGSTLLHNQWSIRPLGQQVRLGDFPVTIAVHPAGRYACILHSGYGAHQIWTVDLATQKVLGVTPVHETYGGLVFSSDGHRLYCTGGGDDVLHSFSFDQGKIGAVRDISLPVAGPHAVMAGVIPGANAHTAFVTVLFSSLVMRVDLDRGRPAWTTALDPAAAGADPTEAESENADIAPNEGPPPAMVEGSDPLGLAFDSHRHRLYATLWGKSDVAVLDSEHGQVLARWPVGLHPNDILLSADRSRLFVSIGGKNSIVVLDPDSGVIVETLSSAFAPGDPPGSTPDSLALSPDGKTLYAANGYNNDIAVFDVSVPRKSRALGFIPTGWFPTSVRLTPDCRQLLVTSGRGLSPSPDASLASGPKDGRIIDVRPGRTGPTTHFPYIGTLYAGSLGIVNLPRGAEDRETALRQWTELAASCRPAPARVAADPANPIPAVTGGATPLRYVIYVIKENRTYDEVFGDLPEGNGDPALCLFPEATTPNLHRLTREFVLLDNFYANAEISASGHEWSMGAYSSEFVERNWPLNYGHKKGKVPYPAEGGYAAAIPSLGYLWDRALAARVTFRDYGEFVHGEATPENPSVSNESTLKGHIDPLYRGWALTYSDLKRADRFIAELHRFEKTGDMPQLQILRLPNDHTEAAKAGALSPRSMVAQNDLAVGRLVEAVSHSKFWPQTAIFVVEDDAQNGPDHVDAHRTEALVISPYVKRHSVDSSAYTSCSILATIEKILGIGAMSQFDAAALPMRASFGAAADLAPYTAVPAQISLEERNPAGTKAAALSARFNFAHEDAIDDQTFNRVLWTAMRGEKSALPAPVHAAFVRPIKGKDDDDDDDDDR